MESWRYSPPPPTRSNRRKWTSSATRSMWSTWNNVSGPPSRAEALLSLEEIHRPKGRCSHQECSYENRRRRFTGLHIRDNSAAGAEVLSPARKSRDTRTYRGESRRDGRSRARMPTGGRGGSSEHGVLRL